ncbi:TPA: GTP cyclohydrolase I FolE2 [Candidatus Latescibacteria bacterium]|nr:GTP cyclohydrolase I FolE2 [Gemmatimonadota bacterium]HAA74234.1 GTP cyclohydrolase I FolE2 [Candidatus Latescibacterota bacterium]|tara:strand:+ start:2891 stop:3736 length:846 start_codon:yes stop_codon:yes gene_type:complete
MLKDIQQLPDDRGIEIDQVGVSNVRYPLTLPLLEGGEFNTVADVSMTVSLPHYQKGTHMSRFMIALNERNHHFHPDSVHIVLEELLERLDAQEAYVDLNFPIFLEREAPVTGQKGLLDYRCILRAMMDRDGESDKLIGVKANVASLCPCSKEISDRGAHNQRSEVSIDVRPTGESRVWFEDLVDVAERSGSCELYPVLKRPDEKFVTERAYDNPKFVEDIVRDVAGDLSEMLNLERIAWFYVEINNFESIHNHDAFAKIERGVAGRLVSPKRGTFVESIKS